MWPISLSWGVLKSVSQGCVHVCMVEGSTLQKWKEDNSQYYPILFSFFSFFLGGGGGGGVCMTNLYTWRKIFHEVMFIITVLNVSLLPVQKEQFARIYPIVITRIWWGGSPLIIEVLLVFHGMLVITLVRSIGMTFYLRIDTGLTVGLGRVTRLAVWLWRRGLLLRHKVSIRVSTATHREGAGFVNI